MKYLGKFKNRYIKFKRAYVLQNRNIEKMNYKNSKKQEEETNGPAQHVFYFTFYFFITIICISKDTQKNCISNMKKIQMFTTSS